MKKFRSFLILTIFLFSFILISQNLYSAARTKVLIKNATGRRIRVKLLYKRNRRTRRKRIIMAKNGTKILYVDRNSRLKATIVSSGKSVNRQVGGSFFRFVLTNALLNNN